MIRIMDLNMTSIRRHLLDNVLFRKKQVCPRACKIIKTRKTLETRYQFHIILFLYAQILQDYFFLLQKKYIYICRTKKASFYVYVCTIYAPFSDKKNHYGIGEILTYILLSLLRNYLRFQLYFLVSVATL